MNCHIALFRALFFSGLAGAVLPAEAQTGHASHEKKMTTQQETFSSQDSLSYALGINYAQWLKSEGFTDLDMKKFDEAMLGVLHGDSLKMTDNSVKMTITTQLQAMMNKKAMEALAAGEKFLADNKTKPGVISLPSGLQYQILQDGTGPKPVLTDKVTVHYEGKLIDGKIFDSSIQRGQPITLGVNQVIKGWTEALLLMPVGSKWRLFVPPDLGYGSRANGQIPANAVLIFDVQLISIQK